MAPYFFLNPQNNVNYSVAVQTPIEQLNSVARPDGHAGQPAGRQPAAAGAGGAASRAGDASGRHRIGLSASRRPESVNHYTVQRVLDVAANVDGRDLGSVASDIQRAINELSKGLPITTKILIRGQNDVMQSRSAASVSAWSWP